MNKFEKPMISVSFFETENIVTVSGAEAPNTYAAFEMNKAMFNENADSTSSILVFQK